MHLGSLAPAVIVSSVNGVRGQPVEKVRARA